MLRNARQSWVFAEHLVTATSSFQKIRLVSSHVLLVEDNQILCPLQIALEAIVTHFVLLCTEVKIKTILWDNDGVLVDTEHLYFRATQEVLASVGFELTEKDFLELFLVEARGAWHLISERGFSADEIENLRQTRNQRYAEYLRAETRLMEGIEDVLKELHGKHRMGIVTSSLREHFDIIHSSSGLLQYFDFVVASGDYTRYKPDPEPYLVALQRANCRADECIAIEDSLRGLLSATGAGIRCYVVPQKLTSASDFSAAYRVLQNVRELLQELDE